MVFDTGHIFVGAVGNLSLEKKAYRFDQRLCFRTLYRHEVDNRWSPPIRPTAAPPASPRRLKKAVRSHCSFSLSDASCGLR